MTFLGKRCLGRLGRLGCPRKHRDIKGEKKYHRYQGGGFQDVKGENVNFLRWFFGRVFWTGIWSEIGAIPTNLFLPTQFGLISQVNLCLFSKSYFTCYGTITCVIKNDIFAFKNWHFFDIFIWGDPWEIQRLIPGFQFNNFFFIKKCHIWGGQMRFREVSNI